MDCCDLTDSDFSKCEIKESEFKSCNMRMVGFVSTDGKGLTMENCDIDQLLVYDSKGILTKREPQAGMTMQ